MKITMSRQLYDASHNTGMGIARVIANAVEVQLPDHLPTAEERLQKDCAETAQLANFGIFDNTQEVTIELDDKVIYAIFRVYEKFGSFIGTLIGVAKPLFGMLKGEMDEVNTLLNQRV